jgi:hypothetical protein
MEKTAYTRAEAKGDGERQKIPHTHTKKKKKHIPLHTRVVLHVGLHQLLVVLGEQLLVYEARYQSLVDENVAFVRLRRAGERISFRGTIPGTDGPCSVCCALVPR